MGKKPLHLPVIVTFSFLVCICMYNAENLFIFEIEVVFQSLIKVWRKFLSLAFYKVD